MVWLKLHHSLLGVNGIFMKIGDIIKNQLRIRRMSIPELEQKTNLSNADLKNIIYNKSKNIDKIKIIANALNISASQLSQSTFKGEFSYKTYETAVRCLCLNFTKMSIADNKEIFDEYVIQMYNYIVDNPTKTEEEYMSYCEGAIKNAINLGALIANK